MNPNYPIPNSAITIPSQSLNGYGSYPSSKSKGYNTMGVYKAGSLNCTTGGTKANQYFRLISNPFDAAIVSIPDSDATAHVLKTIHFNANLSIPTSSGMFVYPTSSPRRNIRWYLFDTVTQTMNLLQEITPDEDLPSNYVYGRQISSGVKIYSNTLASGNIALSGTMNAIFYVIAPPISSVTPQTLTQYAGDELNSLSGVLVIDGVAGVSPPDGTKPFRTLDTTSTPDLSQPLRVKPTVTMALATPIANGAVQSLFKWSTSPAGLPQPLPWGFVKVVWQQVVRFTTTPPTTNGRMIASLTITTYSANPVTGARVSTVNTYQRDVVMSTWPVVPAGAGGGVTTTGLAYGHIAMEVDEYFTNEIGDIEIALINNSLGATMLVDTDSMPISFSMYFYDYYREALKEPGIMMTYEGVTAGQSFTITGAEHWELVPDNDLTRNVASLYNIDDPMKMEAAMAFLFYHLGNPYRFVYPRSKFEALEIANKFDLSDEEFALRCSSIFDKFKSLWSYIKPYAGRAANALITEFTGNPGLAMIGQSILEGQSSGPTFRASSGFRCTTKLFGGYSCTTVGETPESVKDPPLDFCTNELCPVAQIHTNAECKSLANKELNDATRALYVAGAKALKLMGNTEAMRIVFEFPSRGVTNLPPPPKAHFAPGQHPHKNQKLAMSKDHNAELQGALQTVIKKNASVRKGFSCSASRMAALAALAGGNLAPPSADATPAPPPEPQSLPQSKVSGLSDPHMSQKQVWATTRNPGPLLKSTEGVCKFLKAFIPMVFNEGADTRVILGHVVVSNCPIVADAKYGTASYRNVTFTRGEQQIVWRIENHITEASVHQAGPYVDVDLIMALGFEAIYLTIFPHDYTWDTVSGESFELAVASILLGVPCPGMYSGAITDGYRISDIAVKTLGTTVVGKQLFMSRPAMDEVAEVIKALENTTNKMRIIRPREIFMTTGKPIAFYDDDPAVVFLAANMFVPAGGSLQKVAGVSTPSREHAMAIQEQARNAHTQETLYVGKGVYESMTKKVWSENWSKYLAAFEAAGGMPFWNEGDGPKLLARIQNTAKTDGWWKGVKILSNGYQWLDSKTSKKSKKKKKKVSTNSAVTPPARGSISSFANRFLPKQTSAPMPEESSDDESAE